MKKAEMIAVLIAAGFVAKEEDYTVEQLKLLVDIVEQSKLAKDLEDEKALLEAKLVEKEAEIDQLNLVVDELTETIENSELKAKVGRDVVKIDSKMYAITTPKFTMPGGRKYTADDVMKDKELQKEILDGGFAILEEIAE